ncbi:hypothetical protein B0H14DRAFT_463042 [Mycena olivaceomarginata]|nr:hypothetical protein B0H14DRAFT_463042 [Mycena olivaceomarginata]
MRMRWWTLRARGRLVPWTFSESCCLFPCGGEMGIAGYSVHIFFFFFRAGRWCEFHNGVQDGGRGRGMARSCAYRMLTDGTLRAVRYPSLYPLSPFAFVSFSILFMHVPRYGRALFLPPARLYLRPRRARFHAGGVESGERRTERGMDEWRGPEAEGGRRRRYKRGASNEELRRECTRFLCSGALLSSFPYT